jgi:hypothetical protein
MILPSLAGRRLSPPASLPDRGASTAPQAQRIRTPHRQLSTLGELRFDERRGRSIATCRRNAELGTGRRCHVSLCLGGWNGEQVTATRHGPYHPLVAVAEGKAHVADASRERFILNQEVAVHGPQLVAARATNACWVMQV